MKKILYHAALIAAVIAAVNYADSALLSNKLKTLAA